jgi:hypothetical protein
MPSKIQPILLGLAVVLWLIIFILSTLEGMREGAEWVAPVISLFCLNFCFMLLIRRSPRS